MGVSWDSWAEKGVSYSKTFLHVLIKVHVENEFDTLYSQQHQ